MIRARHAALLRTTAAAALVSLVGAAGAKAPAPTANDRPALEPSVETVIVNGQGAEIGTVSIKGSANATDLPNVYGSADGSAHAELSTGTKLDGPERLRDSDGSALILHADQDDHTTQPIGGAGSRIACVIIR